MSPARQIPLAPRVLGELVIVVVGVLIALGVDNWNAGRKETDQETTYLSGILLDLRSDSAALAYRRATAARGLEVADRLMELRRDPESMAAPDSLAIWFFRTAFIDNFQVLDHTYREILGAGGLSLIRDGELRRKVADYYRSMESAEFFTEYYKGEESDYWDLLEARLATDDFEAISRSELGPGRLDSARLLDQLRSNDEIANAILINRHWSQLRSEITERRIRSNRELSETLSHELSER
jgi:hypothetical protein